MQRIYSLPHSRMWLPDKEKLNVWVKQTLAISRRNDGGAIDGNMQAPFGAAPQRQKTRANGT